MSLCSTVSIVRTKSFFLRNANQLFKPYCINIDLIVLSFRVFLTENSLPRDFRLVEWHYLRKPVDFGSLGREVYLGYRTTILHAHTVAITDLTLISVDRVSIYIDTSDVIRERKRDMFL